MILSPFFYVTQRMEPQGTSFFELNICTPFTSLYFHILFAPWRLRCSCFLFLWGLTGHQVSVLLRQGKKKGKRLEFALTWSAQPLGIILKGKKNENFLKRFNMIILFWYKCLAGRFCSSLCVFYSHTWTCNDLIGKRCIETRLNVTRVIRGCKRAL